ncbi:MAG: hypothetical protein J5685_10075 [Clostridiales bacterium]|nr:hypothetical protein [Clostridiales bacterium]
MMSAYLYRLRRQAVKKPLFLVLGILCFLSSVGMIAIASLMSRDGGTARDSSLIIAGFNAIFVVFFNYVFVTALSQGVAGFTVADVNFHLAGPFTSRFNLLLAATNIFKICLLFIWILTCQVALLVNTFGFRSSDMIYMIIGDFIVMGIAYFAGAFLSGWLDEKPVGKKAAYIGLAACDLVFIGGGAVSAIIKAGSFEAFRAMGGKAIVSHIFNSVWAKAFPVAGWMDLFFDGLINNNIVYLIIGLLLVIAIISLLVYLFMEVDFNYYETAITTAEKVEDMREAQKAGLDPDSVRINSKAKVGSETLTKGWGASAFAYCHHLQNKRTGKLFFINTQTIIYRVITLFYLMFMSGSSFGGEEGSGMASLSAALTMTLMLNAVLYGGGKTVLEFNKPFLFLVPEKGSKKLLSCILSDVPEMIFDSIITTAMIFYFLKFSIIESVALFLFLLAFNYLCELLGICTVRLFRGMGRFLLVFMRYILVGAAVAVTLIPAFAISAVINGGMVGTLLICTVLMIPLAVILMFLGRNIVENMEYGS